MELREVFRRNWHSYLPFGFFSPKMAALGGLKNLHETFLHLQIMVKNIHNEVNYLYHFVYVSGFAMCASVKARGWC